MNLLSFTRFTGHSLLAATMLAAVSSSQAVTPVVWFKADAITGLNTGSPLAVWADASGKAHNATQSSPSQRPTYVADAVNGMPAVRFDAANRTCLNFPRTVQDDFTIVCVFQSVQGLNSGTSFYLGAGLVNGEVVGMVNDFGTCLFANGQVCGGTGNPDRAVLSAAGYNDGTPHVLVFQRVESTGQMSLYVDHVLAGTATASTAPLSAPSRLTLGAQQSGVNFFNGDIAEVQLYATALSDDDRQSVEEALFLKYGVSAAPRIVSVAWGPGDPVYENMTVDFAVSAEGLGSLSYQWLRNGLPIPAATNSTLTLPQAAVADSGTYTVAVGNLYGSATSVPITLSILSGAPVPWLDYARLTAGVANFQTAETDTVVLWGRKTFPILAQQANLRSHRVMAGAGYFNDDTNGARAVVFGSQNYFPGNNGGDPGKEKLFENAVRWASRKSNPATITVGITPDLLGNVPLFLSGCGYQVKQVNPGTTVLDLNGCDALVTGWTWCEPGMEADIQAITSFCAAGGGLIAGEYSWALGEAAWSCMGRLLGPFGLKQSPYADSSVSATAVAPTPYPDYYSALPAIDLILAEKAGTTRLSDLTRWTCLDVLDAAYYPRCLNVPESAADPLGNNVPELNDKMAQLEAYYGWIVPTRSKPVALWTMPYETLLTRYQVKRIANWPLTNDFVHPAAADYPGLPLAGATPTNVTVTLNGNTPANLCTEGDWYLPAGVCASPSKAVTVVIPSSLAKQGLRLLVGNVIEGHDLSGWQRDPRRTDLAWQRFPIVAFSTPLTQAVTQVRNPFGGLLTITVPSGKRLGNFNVSFTNVLESPMFFLGQTTDADWNSTVKNRPGPWGCLIVSNRWVTYAPSRQLRALTNPTAVAQMWNNVISNEDWALGCESFRVKPEGVIPQRQMSSPDAAAWSTDPICSCDGYDQELYLGSAPSGYNYYAVTHEVGHHMAGKVRDLLTLNHGENSANIPVSAVDFLAKCGTSWDAQGWPAAPDRLKWRRQYDSWTDAERTWDNVSAGYKGIAGDFHMDFFCNLAEAFGWNLFHDALSRYQHWRAGTSDPELQTVSNYDSENKQNLLYYLLCSSAQRNLETYFAGYGLGVPGKGYEITPAVKSIVASKGYPTWTANQPLSALYGPSDGRLTVPKSALPDTVVFRWRVEDPDPGQVFEYRILSGNTGFAWQIDQRTGVLRVNSINGLQGDYFLQVVASDCGVPRFSLTNTVIIQTTNWANTAPVLDLIPDRVLTAGAILSFTASATDNDQPPQTLTFSLANAPAGATVNPANGLFTWRPTLAQSPSTNLITLSVIDSGAPSMSATRTFSVRVNRPAVPQTSILTSSNGLFGFEIRGDLGPDYVIEATTDLTVSTWFPLATYSSPTLPFTWRDPDSDKFPHRFYRVRMAP